MSHFKKFFLFTLLFFFAGCASDEPQGLSDAELIQAIIDADNKTEVDMESLPSSARSTMEDGYLSEYYHLQSLKASMLGYEVSIAGKPGRLGKRSEIYFDVDGKKLDYSEYEKDSWFYDDDFYNRSESGDKRDWECFSIEYPITVTTPNGNTYTFEDEESVKEYYEAYEIDEDISVVYPINITDNDGELIVIDSDERLKEAYKDCYGRGRDWVENKKCFSLVYPVSYLMPDGTTIEISDDDEESWAEYKSWYDDNPESDERPSLQYPVEITYRTEEGTETQIINSEEEMISAKEECREVENEEDEGYECYEYVYPITFILPDESTVEISGEDDESGWGLIRRFYEQNPNYEEEPALQFPVEVVVEGDMVLVIDTSEDWEVFIEENCDRQE
jgi:hypothetical protein